MQHELVGIEAADGTDSHDWVAECTCGAVTEIPRRDPTVALLDFFSHERHATRADAFQMDGYAA